MNRFDIYFQDLEYLSPQIIPLPTEKTDNQTLLTISKIYAK